jgi:transmembrane sensor
MSRPAPAQTNIDAEAASWIERRHFGALSGEEQGEFDAWLGQSIEHRIAYLRLNASWKRAKRLAALPSAQSGAKEARKFSGPFLIKIAAGFAVLALTGSVSAYFLTQQPRDRIFSTPVGGHETITFSDGTRVELNTNTVLRARMTTDQRAVWLERGEAYFEVKHDPVHPFVVMIGNRRVTDLGTKFTVHRETRKMEVAVVQGKVWFDDPGKAADDGALLTPGDVAVASASGMQVTRKSLEALTAELNWRQGLLVFDKTRLEDVAVAFNRYNRLKLIVNDPAAARVLVGGTFKANDVEDFARLAETVLGLHVKRTQDGIVISH